jgi:maltose alpha-D-glucosyltransferase/alpha-amylase
MDNNRRRIELLNSILFSFPGTPILYYGDEIGMGDNIYLGDRNGVRTPMQWTADRNGGFSRANPAKLYSQLIMDPVYGYEAVNVESQQSDSSSLLHWMRNMIALRKLFRVFGRGTLEFLEPENRKVLAYLRRYGAEQVLCVANLSRFGQPVELDLSAIAGMTPVEMLGFTEFPTIGKAPYRLTLGPYAFFWFELQGTPEPVEVRAPAEAAAAGTMTLRRDAEELFSGRPRKSLETEILPEYLPRQRWFGGKARTIKETRIVDWMWIHRDAAHSALVLVEVNYTDGSRELYDVPLAIATGRQAEDLRESRPDAVLCDLRMGDAAGVLHEALADDAVCRSLLEALGTGRRIPGSSGTAEAFSTGAPIGGDGDMAAWKISRGSAEQSNTSVLFGGKFILKLFRRIEQGPNPDFEIGRYLTEGNRFDGIPALAGGIEYAAPALENTTLAMLQELVPNQGDGWKMTLDELGRYYEERATLGPSEEPPDLSRGSLFERSAEEIPDAVREKVGLYIDSATALGRRTAQMHLALSAPTDDPAFRPEPLTAEDMRDLASGLRDHAAGVFHTLKANLPSLADDVVDRAALTLGQRGSILERFRSLEQIDPEMIRMRIHGDYHLGQVLWVKNDFVILDFEGEPARPLEERRRKQSALKDVAGMLRSFSYAAFAGLLAFSARRPEDYKRLEPWAAFWESWTSAAFFRAYRQTAGDAPLLSPRASDLQSLLEAFLLDKALYELNYELNNRPNWVRIPLHGILGLIR